MLKEKSCIRQSLIPALLNVAEYNKGKKNNDVFLYEIANVYAEDGDNYQEWTHLGFLMSGEYLNNTWNSLNYKVDFYLMKGMVESILDYLGLNGRYTLFLSDNLPKEIHPKINSEIKVDGKEVGYFGKLHPNVTKEDMYVCEIDLSELITHKSSDVKYQELNKYPKIEKDVAFVVNKDIPSADILKEIKKSGGKLLTDIKIFDIYTGDKIAEDKKSIAYNLTFEDNTRTLTEEEVMALFNKIILSVEEKFKASIRDK